MRQRDRQQMLDSKLRAGSAGADALRVTLMHLQRPDTKATHHATDAGGGEP